MNKSELIDALAARYEGNRKAAKEALELVLDTITREVAKGEKVAITGFGSFEKRVREARWVRNPQTGDRVKAKKKAVPKFTPGADLKNIVSGAKKLQKLATPKPAAKKAAPAKAAAPAKSAAKKTTSTAKKASAPAKSAAKKSTSTAKKSSAPAKSAAKKSTSTAKTAAKKSTSTAKKAPAKSTAKKASSTAKKTAAKKAPAKKAPAKKAPAKKSTAKKTTAKKTAKKS